MITVKISVSQPVAEYIRGRFYDRDAQCVRFPSSSDIYVTIYDLMSRRPAGAGVDVGNLEFALPDRRDANVAGGKNPEAYNYISARAAEILERRFRVMMWAELHDYMDECKHLRGIQFKESAYVFLQRYGIESLSEDALLKNYQRWRDKLRRSKRREYNRRK